MKNCHDRRSRRGDEPTADYSLVMPFVVCASQGGPYDDAAFVAGWELGALDHLLSTVFAPRTLQRTVRVASIPQVDLIAMRHRFTVTKVDADDEWALVTFVRTS